MKKQIIPHEAELMENFRLGHEKGFTEIFNKLYPGYIGHIESPNFRAKYNIGHLNELAKLFKCTFKDPFPAKPV